MSCPYKEVLAFTLHSYHFNFVKFCEQLALFCAYPDSPIQSNDGICPKWDLVGPKCCHAALRTQAKKSLKIIAQQSKMDEDAIEFLHKDSHMDRH